MAIETNQPIEVEKGIVSQHNVAEEIVTPNSERAIDNEAPMTAKTWCVIFILTATFGLSFWPVPATAAMQTTLGIRWNDPTAIYWFSK